MYVIVKQNARHFLCLEWNFPFLSDSEMEKENPEQFFDAGTPESRKTSKWIVIPS